MSTGTQIPSQIQEQLGRLQQLQQTLQAVLVQRRQLDVELSENDNTIKELEKMPDDVVIYKSIGAVLVKDGKSKVLDELKENKELVNSRIMVLDRQQKRVEERIKELQDNLQASLGKA